jgi:hypothetical protein
MDEADANAAAAERNSCRIVECKKMEEDVTRSGFTSTHRGTVLEGVTTNESLTFAMFISVLPPKLPVCGG